MRPSPALPWYGYFNPLPPYGGRLRCWRMKRTRQTFQSTPSVWRETYTASDRQARQAISIHSLRMEGDIRYHKPGIQRFHFNPLPPYGGRQIVSGDTIAARPFQSTPSVWRETWQHGRNCRMQHISIHSLRMEGDTDCLLDCGGDSISIHSLRMEGDGPFARYGIEIRVNFNPLPPYGGRQHPLQ